MSDTEATGGSLHSQGFAPVNVPMPAVAVIERRLAYIVTALAKSPEVAAPIRDKLAEMVTTRGGPWDGDVGLFVRMDVAVSPNPGRTSPRTIMLFTLTYGQMEIPFED